MLVRLFFTNVWFYGLYLLVFMIFFVVGSTPLVLGEFSFMIFFDTLSLSLIALTCFLIVLILLGSIKFSKRSDFFYYSVLFFLLVSLVIRFSLNRFFWFYFSFEFSLIPTFLLIMGWGYQPERLQAFIYFFFYTLFASLPLLALIIQMSGEYGGGSISFSTPILELFKINFIYFFFFLAFLVRLPVYLAHLWLPRAHLEAPVSGSMILAGVLLKLGGYGLYRVANLRKTLFSFMGCYIYSLRIIRIVFVGVMCVRIRDMKALVAYSSVAHMGFLICGIFSYLYSRFLGGLVLIISHGLRSSGLFYGVNVMYERLRTRSMYLVRGVVQHLPSVTILIFLLVCSNFSAPPFINLFSELQLIWGTLRYSILILFVFPLGSFLGVVFRIYFFSRTQHGKRVSYNGLFSANILEFHVLLSHVAILVVLVLLYEYLFY